MQENWQISLKQDIKNQYVQNPQKEWVDLIISTSGLLNLTIISDGFVSLSMPRYICVWI
jgi:monomeric isocitrate dehydrogenase